MNLDHDSVLSKVRTEWNSFARENAFHYIASLKKEWAQNDFLDSGESDVAELIDPFLAETGFAARDKTMLEIGCGVGRMTFALAKRFAIVEAVDISDEMIRRAREMQASLGLANARFQTCNGRDLAKFPSEVVDFCFSYIVFQHIPDVSITLGYIREMGRVLRVGGLFKFQINGFRRIRFPRNYYLLWGTSPTHRLRKWNVRVRPHVRFGRLDAWGGVPITVSEVRDACAASDLECTRITGVGSRFMWVSGRKVAGPPERQFPRVTSATAR